MDAAKNTFSLDISSSNKGKSTLNKVHNTQTEELVIGLCYPLGAHRSVVISEIKKLLKDSFDYKDIKVKKLSSFISDYKEVYKAKDRTPRFQEIMGKIKGGDELREEYGNSILADLAIREIHNDRLSENPTINDEIPNIEDIQSRRVCYIVDSIKNIDELNLFRSIYKENFYLFSIYTPELERKSLLHEMSSDEIKTILDIDDKEGNSHGQNVRDTFVDADFFLRVSKTHSEDEVEKEKLFLNELRGKILRYLDLIFESGVTTPFKNESAMYFAKSAAGNSSCLSRQVGACITDEDGNFLSEGWNEVPSFGGSVYSNESNLDRRCFKLGYCSNDRTKDEITDTIFESLIANPILKEKLSDLNVINIFKKELRNSKIKDLIEYSRAVHAEMNAIIKGSQKTSDRMKGGKLFCTTYPCHNCARHIILAGINEVYFIEPYVKSYATSLHKDAITEDEGEFNKVKILFFDGVAPRRYQEFFSNFNDRKIRNTGVLVDFERKTSKPKSMISLQALSTLEQQATHTLNEKEFFKNNQK